MFKVQIGEAMTNKTFRLPSSLLSRLSDVAKREKVSVNNLVRQCCDGIAWINREEDLGVEGLRKAKESYKPDRLLKKYVVREAENA